MKKLYRKGTVHPSPPIISDHLSFLPAAILTLAAALSPEDREVLAYLISFSSSNTSNPRRSHNASSSASEDHSPVFSCSCFRCYTSYWVRWDSSPNRQLIHEIIDAFEEWLQSQNGKSKGGKKDKRNKRASSNNKQTQKQPSELTRSELLVSSDSTESEPVIVENSTSNKSAGEGGDSVEEEAQEEMKGSVRRFVSFIGEKIWGAAWGQ